MNVTYRQHGHHLPHTPTTNLSSGAVVVLGALVGISDRPIPANACGTLSITGVFTFPRAPSGPAIDAGTSIFWDAGAHLATPDANGGANPRLGLSTEASPAGGLVVHVLINH